LHKSFRLDFPIESYPNYRNLSASRKPEFTGIATTESGASLLQSGRQTCDLLCRRFPWAEGRLAGKAGLQEE
jgi:hypothetical protein